MENPLSQKAFSERIKEKTASERQELERLMKIELEMLANGLKKESIGVLSTTKADMEREAEALVLATRNVIQQQTAHLEALKRRWRMTLIGPVVVGLSLSIGISGGLWALMRYQATEILRQQQVLADLEAKGGKTEIRNCGDAKRSRLCVKIDETAPPFQGGYRILANY